MKYFILILLFVINTTSSTTCYASNKEHYARILTEGTYLYKNTNGEQIFELPKTYFVKVVAESGEYYSCTYDGIKGWVKKSDVAIVEGTPIAPYLDETFRIYSSEACNIYKLPTSRSSIVGKGPLYKHIKYLGKIEGEELISGRGKTWYYTTITDNKEIIYGYVYAGLCDDFESYPLNDEVLKIADQVSLDISEPDLSTKNNFVLLIIAVSIPSVLLVYMMYKPYSLARKTRKKHTVYHPISKLYDDKEL